MPQPKRIDEPAEQDDSSGGGKARSGIKYPFYSLGRMIEVVNAVRRAGGDEAPDEDVIRELGIKGKTDRVWAYGIPGATLFGLIERTGRGAGKVKVTALAKRIALPVTDEEKVAAKIEAVKKPELYAKLIDKFTGHPLPSREGLKNIMHRDFDIVESMAQGAADAFIESIKEAGLVGSDGIVAASGTPTPEPKTEKPKPPRGDGGGSNTQSFDFPTDFVPHHFVLRKGDVPLVIPLPHDLTTKDVSRLSKWLATLPMEDDAEETEADG